MNWLGSIALRVLESWMHRRISGGDIASVGRSHEIAAGLGQATAGEPRCFLHVGCGSARKPHVAAIFRDETWREIRLDIDRQVAPDVVGSMTDMSAVATASMDGVYSSHNIEHLLPHEVPVALSEIFRVLREDGIFVLTCPDLQSVCARVAQGKLEETLYESPSGPIAAHDILYGLRSSLAAGNLYMAHRTGFTLETLVAALRTAGFRTVAGRRDEAGFALWAVATPRLMAEEDARRLAERAWVN
ncbi:MAG: methyltransferase domain-containing protein [Sulfurisoma sp.]|nr:methyltransferase domain-containing protein [Sulfurisoma sp.]